MSENIDLQDLPGVGPITVKKMNDAGYYSIESLAVSSVRELVDTAGLTSDTAAKLCDHARKLIKLDFVTAKELWEHRKDMKRITTSCNSLNEVLGGGIETQAMTEFWGEYASGKSQICLQLSVTVQLPIEKGGLDSKTLFIDTEGTFAPQRVYQIAKSNDLDPEKTLENIIYARCYNSDHQQLIVGKAFKLCQEENIKLVIVDSIISHWRSEYIGRESLSERQQKLNFHIHKLLRLAEILNLSVVVTNQVQSNPQAFFGNPNRPAGGNVLSHGSTHRIYLRKSSRNIRVATVTDSPCLPPDKESYFAITDNGIEEVKPKE